ncbi:MAG: flagellar biosynthetic protein FliR [Pseudomonadota bacterium]
MTFSLAPYANEIAIGIAIFCRIGAMMMVAPGFGDFSLSPRVRLAAALLVTVALFPTLASAFPSGLTQIGITTLIFTETATGLFFGIAARIFVSALNVAGQIIALQIGLSLAQAFDPTQELQGAIIGGFLAILGTTMVFMLDLHHLLIGAVVQSYGVFAPATLPPISDGAAFLIQTLAESFGLGARLAAPFVVFGLVFYIGAGVLNRLMPQAQIFFAVMPANLLIGLLLLMLTTGLMMTAFLDSFEVFLTGLLG